MKTEVSYSIYFEHLSHLTSSECNINVSYDISFPYLCGQC